MSEEQRFLSDEERAACQAIAQSSEAPHSQRAVALLAIDAGAPQAGAVVQSGLSIGQLKYCLVRFRNVGLKMFPEIPDNPASLTTTVTDEAVSPSEVVKPKKAKKSKKAKKGKKGKVKKAKASDKKKKKVKGKKSGKKSGKKKKGKKSKKS